MKTTARPLRLRPYQMLCILCALGEGEAAVEDPKLRRAVAAIRKAPDRPITIACNAGDVYCYQDPGTADDTPEGTDFNRKRDLDILQKMNWPPGATLPARTAFLCLMKRITSVAGICGYDVVTADAWRGCPKATGGCYEKACQKGVTVLIPPRDAAEMLEEKERSMAALRDAAEVTIRPHILLCAVCQYGGGTRPPYAPDNLPELMEMILTSKPDIPIKMARQADWMMCAPCPNRAPGLNACVNVLGSGGLSNEKRDLDMLQRLGLTFGSSMPALELFRLIFERIPSTADICRREGSLCPSVWWDGCGESNLKAGNPKYEKGRQELMAKFASVAGA